MTIESARLMEDTARIAYCGPVRWLVTEYRFDEMDCYMLLIQASRVRFGNMADLKYMVAASIAKSLLLP